MIFVKFLMAEFDMHANLFGMFLTIAFLLSWSRLNLNVAVRINSYRNFDMFKISFAIALIYISYIA